MTTPIKKCHGCGAEKNPADLEVYPYPEDERLTEDPIPPLLTVECQPADPKSGWRMATVCHHCFHRLDVDMWIGQRCWESLSPVTDFRDLPTLVR
jgi:hypothetical protein